MEEGGRDQFFYTKRRLPFSFSFLLADDEIADFTLLLV